MRSAAHLPLSTSPRALAPHGLRALGSLLAAGAFAAALAGCGGSPSAPARDEVFYLHASGIIDKNYSWETYFKPLDQAPNERLPRIVGVGIFNGDVRIGRPIDWYIRSVDYTPQHRFISYQSPRQFLFSIYERIDNPEDTWTEVLRRYEADVDGQGSQILAGRMPIGTANTQGRTYILKTRVPSRPDYQNYAHETLVRSEHRLLLVQIVHGENIDATADEMVAALKSLTVY
ncbi:MAG: hypothetical protein U0359_11835 [Byssovorax sp.]